MTNNSITMVCITCGSNGEAVRFYDGIKNRCAKCHAEKVRKNRAKNVEYYRKYDSKRFQENPKRREANKLYAATPTGAAVIAAAKARWQAKNPAKRACHIILCNAVRDGLIKKPKSCSVCGVSGVRIHGHHEDYTKPMNVKWLCPACHSKEHGKCSVAPSQ